MQEGMDYTCLPGMLFFPREKAGGSILTKLTIDIEKDRQGGEVKALLISKIWFHSFILLSLPDTLVLHLLLECRLGPTR